MRRLSLLVALLGSCSFGTQMTQSQPVPGASDTRLSRARTNNEGINFQPYADRARWQQRRKELRQQILVATGLWPIPAAPRPRAQVYGRVDRDGYAVEKVVLETYTGFYLAGNLYRPLAAAGRRPGILCPHGHWAGGRFETDLQARCVGFARLGGVAFLYDMVGFGDSRQFGHRFSNDALVLQGLNLAGLQLWNSMRALDFLAGLPDVDPQRIACTGESGGGTQTFLLAAVDDRVRVAAPVCMVSHAFQGGCECENSPALRYDTDNVEIAAAFAPKPQILVNATGDWTKEVLERGYPEIRGTYRLMAGEANVHAVLFDAPHNYNKTSREAVYRWFGKHLFSHPAPESLFEAPFQPESPAALTVWDADHPRPAGAATPASLQSYLEGRVVEQVASLLPRSRGQWRAARAQVRTGLRHLLGAREVGAEELHVERIGETTYEDYHVRRLVIGRKGRGDRVPALLFTPLRSPDYGVVLAHEGGKSALLDPAGEPGGLVAGLLREGLAVLAIDAFLTGEQRAATARPRPDHFFTYNRSTLAERVQDLLTAVACLKAEPGMRGVHLAGVGRAGPWCLLARAVTDRVSRVAADADQFEYALALPAADERFSPGMLRYGGLKVVAAIAAPRRLLLHNTGDALDTSPCRTAYELEAASADLELHRQTVGTPEIVAFLSR